MRNTVVLLSLLGSLPFTTASPGVLGNLFARNTDTATDTATETATPILLAPPTRSHPTSEAHSPFRGTPTVTGALTASSIGSGISSGTVAPSATTYSSDGKLHNPEPAPFVPAGGVGTNGTIPVYNAKSDFDYESLSLALYQAWLELDLFQNGLSRFSENDFKAAGLNAQDLQLIAFMAQQEVGHATMLSNILGAKAPQQCSYNYPFTTVQEFIDFSQKITQSGESGVYGFMGHLNSREAATLLSQSVAIDARQQMIFRQFQQLQPMPVWFVAAVPQSWAWTLLAPYISSCPSDQTRLVWQNFPGLRVLNQPSLSTAGGGGNSSNNTLGAGTNVATGQNSTSGSSSNSSVCGATVASSNSKRLSFPGRQVALQWDAPGQPVGPNNSYVTSTQAGKAKYVAWVSQLNVTYSPLRFNGNSTRGYTTQPNLETYQGDPAINGTVFIAITDSNPVLSPFNISLINPHVVAGPALYQAG